MVSLSPNSRRIWIALALLIIFVANASAVLFLHPKNLFGLSEDDSIYFSSAKALAEGRGYILPSVPGTPPATKYPILYPWLLSWVWRWNPSFPSNLSLATALNIGFGFVFLTTAFVFLRQMKGINDVLALILTAFCALHPLVLFYTANLVADVPFAAMCLASIGLASRAIDDKHSMSAAVLAGILSGLALLLRILGAPVAVALYLVLLFRGGWRKSTTFAVSVAPFLFGALWRSIFSFHQSAPNIPSSCANSWQNTWLYYTNYLAFWRVASIEHHALWQNLATNTFTSILQPGGYFADLHLIGFGVFPIISVVLLSVGIARGCLKEIRTQGWHPVYPALGLYLIPVLLWDYITVDRFLLPFLPLFAACLIIEAQDLFNQIRNSLRRSISLEPRLVAALFSILGVGLLVLLGLSWWRGIQSYSQKSREHGALLKEKQEAYVWLKQNTLPGARFIAYEDASAFLYSGRQGIRPMVLLPARAYQPESLQADLLCLTSSAAPTGASYWIISDDDFGFEWESAVREARAKQAEAEKAFRLLFQSDRGHVRIYALEFTLP